MKMRPGIKLIKEIEGYGNPIVKGDRFEAVFKYYYNKGDPILFETYWHKLIPEIKNIDGKDVIAWQKPEMIKSNIIYAYDGWLARHSGLPPGIYYATIGMKTMGYRFVSVAPHFLGNIIHDGELIKEGSVIKVEIFLIRIFPQARTRP